MSGGALQIAVDFDGVLFDQAPHVRRTFRELHGVEIGPPESWGANLADHPEVRSAGLEDEQIWQCFHTVHKDASLHRCEPLDAHALRVMQALRDQGHEVLVVTARRPEAREPTELFIEHNGVPHDGLVMDAHRKTGYDVLVDDMPHHVMHAVDAGGRGLLFDQPYNRGFACDGNPARAEDWRHVERLIGGLRRPDGASAEPDGPS